ncbi:hypothetical protein NKDENANG_02875 [Candidatus Entotheonellaceae bacterium PAL068K]
MASERRILFRFRLGTQVGLALVLGLAVGQSPVAAQSGSGAEPRAAVPSVFVPWAPNRPPIFIEIKVSEQTLELYKNGRSVARWPISTSAYGVGATQDSLKTPLGMHQIYKLIGHNLPFGAIIKGRVPTGEIAQIISEPKDVPADVITTRIIWLDGLEKGKNRGAGIDSKSRFIYIHGTAEEGLIGRPASNGCIRMKNKDVIELFDQVEEGVLVYIHSS